MQRTSPLVSRIEPSPNIEPRHNGRAVDMLLLHYTGMSGPAERAVRWLCAPESKVSCHYLIDEEGTIVQMVEEGMRAWHAGLSSWEGETDTNSRSIGIEIANPGYSHGYPDFPEAQMQAVVALCQDVVTRHDIRPERVLAHSDVAPTRKSDPGHKFDWARLARAGVGLWVEPSLLHPADQATMLQLGQEGAAVRDLQQRLIRLGYGLLPTGRYDALTEATVTAFQRHWRQSLVDGRADRSTRSTLDRLLVACRR